MAKYSRIIHEGAGVALELVGWEPSTEFVTEMVMALPNAAQEAFQNGTMTEQFIESLHEQIISLKALDDTLEDALASTAGSLVPAHINALFDRVQA